MSSHQHKHATFQSLQHGGRVAEASLVIGQPGQQRSTYKRANTLATSAAHSPAGALIRFEPLNSKFDGIMQPRGISARRRREGLSSASRRENKPGVITTRPAMQQGADLQQKVRYRFPARRCPALPPGGSTRCHCAPGERPGECHSPWPHGPGIAPREFNV